MHSAAPFARMTGDPRLAANIEASAKNLLSAQQPDGYLGSYCPERRYGGGWDVWGTKYTLLGLLYHYDLTGSAESLVVRFCDYASAGSTWDSSSSYRVWLPLECFKPTEPVVR